MKSAKWLTVLVISAVSLVACGKSPSAPSEQSAVTINGSVVAPASSAASGSTDGRPAGGFFSTAATVPPGLQVSVAGTNISALVDAAGKFALLNVPPGNADLRFTAPAFSAALTLAGLEAGQTVAINVSLSGTSAVVLESERRRNGSEEQLEGRVEALPPTTAAGSLVVAGRTVVTDASTLVYLHGQPTTFSALVLGQRVHVKGQPSGSNLLARLIDIQNTNTDVGMPINGVISNFSGTPAAFQFNVNGQLIKGDAATEFYGNTQFVELVDGATVAVKGSPRDGFVYAARIHVSAEDIQFTGVIASKSGTSPDLTLTIGAYTVKTTSLTDVKRKGDTQDPSVLYVGQTVDVSGRLIADGSVAAWKINIAADVLNGYFEMEGKVGSLSGTCQTLTFQVSGYVIKTDATTTFLPTGSCSSLHSGDDVTVKGTFLADLSVKATEVKKN